MKLAFCVIVEGDSKLESMKALMKSVEGVFDTIHITANRNPHKKLKAWVRKNGWDFSFKKWGDDYSAQRNFNFSRVPPDTDYIIWADSDDVIVNAHLIRDIAKISIQKEYDCVFCSYWYGVRFSGKPSLETFEEVELPQMRERFIRPGSIEWKKRVHETPVPFDGDRFSYTKVDYSEQYPLTWLHLGADREISKEDLLVRMERNQRLLELELEDERRDGEADPRTLLYLMKIYTEKDEREYLEKCIEMGEEYLSKSGWDQERAVCYDLMSRCIGKLGDHEKARSFLMDAIKEYPYKPLLYLSLARAYYNLNDYRAMNFWLKMGLQIEVDDKNTNMTNLLEMKILSAELMIYQNLYYKKDIRKAHRAARLLNKLNPTENNQQNEEFLAGQAELDIASEHAHKLMQYAIDHKKEYLIPSMVKAMPSEMGKLPFAWRYLNRYKEPRYWKSNEICYFASFGTPHFEKWDGNSLKKGIGGSETMVIRTSEELVKRGWKVVVYGDPKKPVEINGVVYLPFYMFNQRDFFNIFIQWRHNSLAGKVSCKKFLVDLHDVFYWGNYIKKLASIDKLIVKSKYHRGLAKQIPDDKFFIVSNGIEDA